MDVDDKPQELVLVSRKKKCSASFNNMHVLFNIVTVGRKCCFIIPKYKEQKPNIHDLVSPLRWYFRDGIFRLANSIHNNITYPKQYDKHKTITDLPTRYTHIIPTFHAHARTCE